MLVPGDGAKKWLALATTLVTFVVSLLLLTNWQDGQAGMQFVEDVVWFAPLGIRYPLGVDGISLFLVLLTTFLMPIAVYFSNLYVDKNDRPVSGAHAAAGDGHDRRLPGAGPGALLRLLRGEPDPDVLPDRRMGRHRTGSMPRSSSSSTPSPARR